jgi:hypothetical protein
MLCPVRISDLCGKAFAKLRNAAGDCAQIRNEKSRLALIAVLEAV